ncbi:MAG: hypothetical protein ACMXYE_02885 [Candidatus Woesearchaeota archaeon]
MAKLQELVNKKQGKTAYTISVPSDIVKLLKLKKGQEFAVRFDEKKRTLEYIPVKK